MYCTEALQPLGLLRISDLRKNSKLRTIRITILLLFHLVLFAAWELPGHAETYAGEIVLSSYLYISPMPFSNGHNPESEITLRYGPEIDQNSIERGYFSLEGEISGKHEVRVKLTEDNKTLIIRSGFRFAWNEKVIIRMDEGIKTISGSELPAFQFWFRVRHKPERIPVISANSNASSSPYSQMLKSSQVDKPSVKIIHSDNPSPGYIYSTVYAGESGYLYAFDNYGTNVFCRKFPYLVYNFAPHPTGNLAYHDYELDGFVALDKRFQPVDTFFMANGYMANMHEFVLQENGHFLMLAYDYRPMNLSQIIEDGDSNALVVGFIIQEFDENRDLQFQWRSWDHLEVSDTYEECKANFLGKFTICDFAHANSIQIDSDTSLIISTRNMSEITRINRQTGEIIWRMGGKNNEFSFFDDTKSFSGQHTAFIQSNGNLTLYDNGYNSDSLYSRGLEYSIDQEQKSATLLTAYQHDPQVYGFAMGNLQRLENNHTLIYWGAVPGDSSGPVSEYDASGKLVFEAQFENISLPSYRCLRSEWESEVFTLGTDSLHFIQTSIEKPASESLQIRNNTDGDISVNTLLSRTGSFNPGDNFPLFLPAGGSGKLEILFQEDSIGSFMDVLTLCYDTDTSRLSVQLPVSAHVLPSTINSPSKYSAPIIKPLPVQNNFEISSSRMIAALNIFDIHGRLVYSDLNQGTEFTVLFDIAEIGVYILKIRYTDGSEYRSRILKTNSR